ncbi:histidine-type phosphatase [Phanerochaete sordida]|uniref:Histidine-type phosphatase n=1 Tax=Phanerochaete sordida TaxID=48140 RepID=A0A9P3LHH2_9APHY|nr:histidine-type phosphatase [Phanerochaete sordida]
MSPYKDVESGAQDKLEEREALLPTSTPSEPEPARPSTVRQCSFASHPKLYTLGAFAAGVLACLAVQYVVCSGRGGDMPPPHRNVEVFAPPYAGSSEVHHFPPTSPTNVFPSLFPTDVGHAGPTPTGAEPALIATAPSYPVHTGAPHLVAPTFTHKGNKTSAKFDLFKHWGNLSPWFSVERGAFGLDSSPEVPETCRITGLHLVHRHGARYPTQFASYGGPANFSGRLNQIASKWTTTGDLAFMNEWTYKLGEEVLTPFGRQQLFDLGVATRLKYGLLLKNFSETNTIPVFRTESQDRMLASALNFAIGFFGYPFEGQYQQSITIEARGFNNTLAPYKTCPNADDKTKADRGTWFVRQWADIYLKDAQARLAPQMHGYNLTIEDLYTLQQMCAYETVAIGYSKFCELFTEEEWVGFDYALDLYFWYDSAFGSPVARVQGIGYVQELVARLTHTPIATHNSSTNATLDDSEATFPLGQSLYVDATHEVVVLNILTALNLTNFAAGGPLPYDHIPAERPFKVSHLAPFATNVHFQLLACDSVPGPQIRIIVNDGVVPLTSVRGCPAEKDGLCPLDTFVEAMKEMIATTDWAWGCHGDWSVPGGYDWNTTVGYPPAPA